MISHRMTALAHMLRLRPDLAPTIACRLDELAECVRNLEHTEVPPRLTETRETLPANVQRIDDRRRRPA